MDERADGGRAPHGVRQPGEERALRALAADGKQQEERDGCLRPAALHGLGAAAGDGLEEAVVLHGAVVGPDEEDGEGQAQVADPVHHERLLVGRHRARLRGVVADQHVRAEAHAFPPEVQADQVVAHHQDEHAGDEEAHREEEARVARLEVGLHVLAGVQGDQRGQHGDEHHPQEADAVDVEAEVGGERLELAGAPADREPVHERHRERRVRGEERGAPLEVERDGKRGREREGEHREEGGQAALDLHHGERAAEDHGHERCQEHPLEPCEVRSGGGLDEVECADVGVARRGVTCRVGRVMPFGGGVRAVTEDERECREECWFHEGHLLCEPSVGVASRSGLCV